LRLARGMTYKYAAAGVNLGGGKAVIIGDPLRKDREPVFRALESLSIGWAADTSREKMSALL
jgi:glutamate dehydrogenase/leucine dehydrogenase